MAALKELVGEAQADVDGIVTHTLSQSLDDPGFLKRAMALVYFDEFCADCTTVSSADASYVLHQPSFREVCHTLTTYTGSVQNDRRAVDGTRS